MLKPMNVLDGGLLMMESPATPMHIGGVQVIKLPRGAGPDFVSRAYDEAKRFPVTGVPFNCRLAPRGGTWQLPAWEVLDHVDLDQHVFRHALPWPGGERELLELVARLNSGLLDRSRPLWEQHFIEGLAAGRYAVFTRIHHALMDGKWGMKIADETTSPDPRRRNLPPYWAVSVDDDVVSARARSPRAPELNWWGRQSQAYKGGIETVAELRKAFGRLVESFRHPRTDALVAPYTAPACLLYGKLTARRELAVVRIGLDRVRAVADASQATVNEVLCALCGASLRRYLAARDALPEKSLVAGMPMAMARRAGEAGGNAVINGWVWLATDLADPVERLHAVRESSRRTKELVRDMPSTTAISIYFGVVGIPFIVAQAAGAAEHVHPQNVLISNVPGPREKRYINGCLVEAEYPLSVLVPGQAMNITIVGHDRSLDVAVLVCPDLAPQPQAVSEGIEAALGELEQALAAARPASTVRRRTTTPAGARR